MRLRRAHGGGDREHCASGPKEPEKGRLRTGACMNYREQCMATKGMSLCFVCSMQNGVKRGKNYSLTGI